MCCETDEEAWKRAVLNGDIELEDIDTAPQNYKARLKPSLPPSVDTRDMVAGAVGRPASAGPDTPGSTSQ